MWDVGFICTGTVRRRRSCRRVGAVGLIQGCVVLGCGTSRGLGDQWSMVGRRSIEVDGRSDW